MKHKLLLVGPSGIGWPEDVHWFVSVKTQGLSICKDDVRQALQWGLDNLDEFYVALATKEKNA